MGDRHRPDLSGPSTDALGRSTAERSPDYVGLKPTCRGNRRGFRHVRCCKPFLTFASRCEGTRRAMQYKGFDIKTFEQEPGKWRARIFRANGRPSNDTNQKLQEFVASADPSSAVDTLILAMEAIDDLLSRNSNWKMERHWRVLLRTSEISGRGPALMRRKLRRRQRTERPIGLI
jgi:hypothetical protein